MSLEFASLTPAMQRQLSLPELVALTSQMALSGQTRLILGLYQEWLAHNASHPLVHFAYFNYSVVLTNVGELPAAKEALTIAIGQKPDFFAAYINLGNLLERLVSPQAAAECWQQLVDRLSVVNLENIGYKNMACKQIGRVLTLDKAEFALQQSLELNPRQHDALEHWISWRQQQCKWPVIVPFGTCDKAHLMQGFAPLSLAAYTDDPMLQLATACMYNKTEIGQPAITFLDDHKSEPDTLPSAPIRVGYLSSDLRMHAIGFLMGEIFGLHDRGQVEVFVYNTSALTHDQIQNRIQGAVEHWCDLVALSDEEAARRILADRIEILIDVNGYTQSARLKMLAMRPAPIIVNWLGFPGTMGSPYHHYILADGFIIPFEHEIFYSEKVLRLPCYQPNDRQRYVVEARPTRQEMGLPEEAMVYSCFNGVRKITAFTWRLWCEILQQVPGSVLWLMHENDAAQNRLLELAAEQGIGQERVIFATMQANHLHLARYPLVDLVLDTFPYGAHTTASDAFWMGVPILTLAGLSFASRVCGSLVSAAGLPDLVCATPEEYVARAVAFGQNRALLLPYRQKILAQRDTSVLFDTSSLVSHLERLFVQMRADFRQGNLPRPDLSNLELYQEIGIELDGDGASFQTLEGLLAAYTKKLSQKDALSFLRDDGRLWSSAARALQVERRRLGFLETVVRLDDARDLGALLQFVQMPSHETQAMLLAVSELIQQVRLQAAYIVAMVLANQGQHHPAISIALCVGGVLQHNPQEEMRGRQTLPAELETIPQPLRSLFATTHFRPVEQFLQTLVPDDKVAGLLELLRF